jgi:AraC-like DNA-binding protein
LATLPPGASGWLGALGDVQIGSALGFIHQSPELGWTVQSLAAKVAMSRSAFASRFARLVGEPPLAYVTRWRMQKAAGLLRQSSATLADIAERVGYDSEAAFSKAFKRAVGTAPGAYRRAAKASNLAVAA